MTSGEFKFALQVERVLNMIPQPEYRQLMVEALMVTTFLVESDCRVNLVGQVIHIDKLVHEANDIFIKDQVQILDFFIRLHMQTDTNQSRWQQN